MRLYFYGGIIEKSHKGGPLCDFSKKMSSQIFCLQTTPELL